MSAHERSSEPVTLCEVVVCDYEDDDIDEGFELEGVEEGQVIKPGEFIDISFKGTGDDLSIFDSLLIGYAIGTEDDLDEDDELMTEEELVIKHKVKTRARVTSH